VIYNLREYQQQIVNIAVDSLKNNKENNFIVAPTGAGKSIIIANIVKNLNSKVLVLQNNKEILQQNYNKYISYDFEASIFSASCNIKEIGDVTFAMIQSIYKLGDLFKNFKYVIVDECHLIAENSNGMYNTFLKSIGSPNVLGLTATPYKNVTISKKINNYTFETSTSLKMINRMYPSFFKKMLYNIEISYLQEQGFLSELVYQYPDDSFSYSNMPLNSTGADFKANDMDLYISSNERIKACVNGIIKNFKKRKLFLVFASSKKQAEKIQKELGLESSIIYGTTSGEQRESIIKDFKEQKIKVIINIGVLTTGFDCPELDCIVLCRPTLSLSLLYQMIGRGLRIAEGKENCLILDCCNITKKLGRIETIKITKEVDSFKDIVETENGVISGIELRKFIIEKKENKLI